MFTNKHYHIQNKYLNFACKGQKVYTKKYDRNQANVSNFYISILCSPYKIRNLAFMQMIDQG